MKADPHPGEPHYVDDERISQQVREREGDNEDRGHPLQAEAFPPADAVEKELLGGATLAAVEPEKVRVLIDDEKLGREQCERGHFPKAQDGGVGADDSRRGMSFCPDLA